MNFVKCVVTLAWLAGIGFAPALAEPSVTGRWAADPASCAFFGNAAQSPLIVTDSAVRWHEDACRIARVYKTGDTVHIQALCWGNAGERSVPVSLRPHGGKLALTWDRGRPGDLRRCE
ncbi:MAG TPA: hypothetical protein VFC54_09340 [Pseudolabrys sp.]|nr:hypothetical protein [Pseudolabrys sp.]